MIYAKKLQINDLVDRLQRQTDVPAWVVASSSTVLAVAAEEKENYGPRGKWFYRLFNTLGVTLAAQLALQLVGSVVVTTWWLRCKNVPRSAPLAEALFIGFGAGPERQMLEQFRSEVPCQIAHIDQTKPVSLASVVLPSLMQLWKACAVEARKVVQGLRSSKDPLIRDFARQWLVSAAIRLSPYVFVKIWAESLPAQINHLVFISADIPAFAALDAKNSDKRKIEYRQHGLLRISIVLPPFKILHAMNRQEALHMKSRLANAAVTYVPTTEIPQIFGFSPTILFVSIYDFVSFSKHDYKDMIGDIKTWAKKLEFRLIVRPHPREGVVFWQQYYPDIPLDVSTEGLGGALYQYKPLFVVSWFSTALLDALKSGVLPILIMDGSKSALKDMVFPLADIALNWPRDLDLIQRLIEDPDLYRNELANRQQTTFGALN